MSESTKIWAGAAGQDSCRAQVYQDPYLYAGLYTRPAQVVQINPLTMATVATWTGAGATESWPRALVSDGTYIYVALNTIPALVIKIDPSTMTTVRTWRGGVLEDQGGALTFHGTSLYLGLIRTPAMVIEIEPVTMTTVSRWTGAAGQNLCHALRSDGTYLYAGLYLSPAQVVKIDPAGMTTVATWTGDLLDVLCSALAVRGSYVYAGLWSNPVRVVKISSSTMLTDSRFTGEVGQWQCGALEFGPDYLCVGTNNVAMRLIRLNYETMEVQVTWRAALGYNRCRAITYDGSVFTYLGLSSTPARVIGILSDEELAGIFPQHVRLQLGIRSGNILWNGLVNQSSFEPAVYSLAYDGASGAPSDPGAYTAPYLIVREPTVGGVKGVVKGMLRISSVSVATPTTGTFYFAHIKAINWADNDVLEILDFIPLYTSPLTHSANWSRAQPVPIMGPHRMGFVDEAMKFIGNDSYGRKGRNIANYSWTFPSGTPATSIGIGTRADPISVTWAAAGEYVVSLEVQDSAGESYTTHRSVLIYERTGANAPYDAFTINSLSGDWAGGGFTCEIDAYETPTLAGFPDHALVIIRGDEWYGDYRATLGDELGAEDHLFVGYVVAGSQTLDAQTETVTLDVATVQYLMDRMTVWPEVFKTGTTYELTADYTQFSALTLDDVAFHILEEHTTLRKLHDIHCDIIPEIKSLDIPEGTLLGLLNDQIFNVRFGQCASSRLSNLYIAQDRQFEAGSVQSAHATEMILGKGRWLNSLDLGEELAPDQVSQLEIEAFTAALFSVTMFAPPFDPSSPGEGNWGAFERLSEILVQRTATQEAVDEAAYFAGQAIALRNARYKRVAIETANWRQVDPARQDYVQLKLDPADTLRGHDWSAETLICRSLTWSPDPQQTIECEPVVQGIPGDYWALSPEHALTQELAWMIVIAQAAQGQTLRAFYTSSFDEAELEWAEFSNGLTGSVFYDFAWDPFNKYQMMYIGSYQALFRWQAPLGQETEWENILTAADFTAATGLSGLWHSVVRVETSEKKQGFIAAHVVNGHPDDASYVQSRVFVSLDWGEHWTASAVFTFSGSDRQYYPGSPGVLHLCLNDLDGCRHSNGLLYATAGMIDPSGWHSVLYESVGWSTDFVQISSRAAANFSDNKGAIHVPYEDNSSGNLLYWLYSGEVDGTGARLLRSTNGGGSWSSIAGTYPQTIRQARIMDTHEDEGDYAAVYRSRLGDPSGYYLSTDAARRRWDFRTICDGKAGWQLGKGILHDISFWPVNKLVMLAGGESFLRMSGDAGVSWVSKAGDLEELLGRNYVVRKIVPYW